MPVECYGECCINCPELEIDIVTKETYDLEKVGETNTQVKTVKFENTLRCPHLDRCKVIFENGKPKSTKSITSKTETTRKSTSKSTSTAKKTTTKKAVKAK